MRIRSSWSAIDNEAAPASIRALHRQRLLAVLAAGIGLALAFAPLLAGDAVPFTAMVAALAAALLALGEARSGRQGNAALIEIVTLTVLGLGFALVDAAPLDFGLAILALASLYAVAHDRRRLAAGVAAMLLALPALSLPLGVGHGRWGFAAGLFALALAGLVWRAGRAPARRQPPEPAQLQQVLQTLNEAVLRFEADGRIGFVSSAAEKLFNCQAFALTAKGVLDRVHVLDRPAYLAALDLARHRGEPQVLLLRMRRDDVSAVLYATLEIKLSRLGADGAVIGLLREAAAEPGPTRQPAREAAVEPPALIELAPVTAASLLEAAAARTAEAATTRNVRLALRVEPHLPAIAADAEMIVGVVARLIGNALEASASGEAVTLLAKRQGHFIRLSVGDLGLGPVRSTGARPRVVDEAELGLADATRIVAGHGGRLVVHGRPGLGTKVTLLLPINGPETKTAETAFIRPLRPMPAAANVSTWQDEKRRAL